MPLWFNAAHLPEPSLEYVAWVDVMGTQISMSRSLAISANFIFKLYTAALQTPNQNITLYPIMDGFYASSSNKSDILRFLQSVFEQVAEEFNREEAQLHRFIVRGSLAFGSVIHGSNIPEPASNVMHDNVPYRNSLLLGLPMVQAHTTEKLAPPFGIYVHESARNFAPHGDTPLHFLWWKWANFGNPNSIQIWNTLRLSLEEYFTWCRERSGAIGYDSTRIEVHSTMANQYFL